MKNTNGFENATGTKPTVTNFVLKTINKAFMAVICVMGIMLAATPVILGLSAFGIHI